MKQIGRALLALMLVASFSTQAMAADEDDVKAAVVAMFEALANYDADGWIDAHTANPTLFGGGPLGAMLADGTFDRAATRAQFEQNKTRGVPPNVIQVQHLNAKVMGNVAYTTAYLILTNGNNPPQRWRSTMIWIKQSGQWKRDHYHSSPLYPNQPTQN